MIEEFSRYEFKYILSAQMRQQIEYGIMNFMRYDGYAHPEMDNCYFVRSLYFDDDLAHRYHQKIDGVKSRRKFRLRTYAKTYHPETPIFLEEKGRVNERTYKRRVQVDHNDLSIFLNQENATKALDKYPGNELIEQFVYDSFKSRIKQKVIVDYLRKPYTSDYDENFRVTFDSFINCAASNSLFSPAHNWFKPNSVTIMEVKFSRRIPSWFHRILQTYDLRRESISKFCIGMEVCGLAKNLS